MQKWGLKKEIDLAILDIQNRNYGKAEERLFDFLDVLDVLEKRLRTYEEQWASQDGAWVEIPEELAPKE